MNLIDQIKNIFQTRQQQKAADFTELVDTVARGNQVSPEDVALLLEDCGKTPEQLQAEVEYKTRRLEMAAVRDTLPAIRAEQAEIAKAWDTEAARWIKLVEAHNAIVNPLTFRALDLERQVTQALGMSGKLQTNYRGPLRERLAEIQAQRMPLHVQCSALRDLLNQRRRSIQEAELVNASCGACVSEATIEGYRYAAAQYEAQIAPLQAQIEALNEEERATEAAMCEP